MPMIVWCDLMKCGRMSATELDEYATLLGTTLRSRYRSSAAVVVAPFLVSERHQGYRGQLRMVRAWLHGLLVHVNSDVLKFLVSNPD